MIDILDKFDETLVGDEIRDGIKATLASVKSSSNSGLNNPDFPESMNALYRQVDRIDILWQISTREKGEEFRRILANDPWIKENYWDLSTGWGIMEDYMTGNIGIQKLEDMLNPAFCKEHIFDGIIKGLNSEDFMPFDLHWNIMACLKRENGKILDNVWIVYYDAEEMYDMKVTIEKYLDLCYKAKGFYDWQLSYMFRGCEHHERMERYLPMFFPHLKLDLSDFGIGL